MPRPIRIENNGAVLVLATLLIVGFESGPSLGQQSQGSTVTPWPTLVEALQATTSQGIPTVVVVTSKATPASISFREALANSPEGASMGRFVRFAEMSAEVYPSQVKNLRISSFPALIVYRQGRAGLEAAGLRSGFADARQAIEWLDSLNLSGQAAVLSLVGQPDSSVARAMYQQASGQSYSTEQQPAAPPKSPPTSPPYVPPTPTYSPPSQQPTYASPPPQYAPAPPPYYLQTQTPAMVLQQAPQQIVLAPPPPPQITVAMAPPPVYSAPGPIPTPPPNLFAQPMQAPQLQPMLAPQPPPQPMQAPMAMPAIQQYSQAPANAIVLQAPGLLNSMLGTFGEYLARRRNPRIQMSAMPMLAQAPIANAPVGLGYAPVTAYAAAGPPVAVVTPESTSFAPCNTYNAPCKYHGGPCPGPGGGYVPPLPSYPTASPQSNQPPRSHGLMNWLHHRN